MNYQRGLLALAFFVVQWVSFQGVANLVYGDPLAVEGVAFATQANDQEYGKYFGRDWESVRTFRLMNTLSRPLRVYVETSPSDASLYRKHYLGYIEQSLAAWSQALDGRLTYMYTEDPKQADITVRWVPGFEDKYTAGVTVYRVGHADIQIKTRGVPDRDIKANIIHEFGHALGIAGHSEHKDDIMVGMRRWQRDNQTYNPTLSPRDVQAIRHLYSSAWHKGEDLYSASVQNPKPSPVVASQQANVTGAPKGQVQVRWTYRQVTPAKQ